MLTAIPNLLAVVQVLVYRTSLSIDHGCSSDLDAH